MAKRWSVTWVLAILCVACISAAASAEWVRDGIPAGAADYYQYDPRVVSDGAGGIMIVWNDQRSGSEVDIYGNRVTGNGIALGGLYGVSICTANSDQYVYGLIDNGAGSAIIAWYDQRDGQSRTYAQRIDTMGNIYWAPDGMDICPAAGNGSNMSMAPDGMGGAIFAWYENRGSGNDIYAQRIDAAGNLLWGDAGVRACYDPSEQYTVDLVPDGAGGAIIAWADFRADGDIYAQRLDAAGEILWDSAGVAVCTASAYQDDPHMVSAPGGGAYILWEDGRFGVTDAFVQRINATGAPVWTSDGISVCDDAGMGVYKYFGRMAPDGAGGVIVAWLDYRDFVNFAEYGQRFDPDGTRAWGPTGVLLIPSYSCEGAVSLTPDGGGGAIVAVAVYWDDNSPTDIYVQKVDHDGQVLWGTRGAAVCTASGYQYSPSAVPDGLGGALVAWQDYRPSLGGMSDVYCQRVSPSGLWGYPEPSILSCADVPADQGGWVRLVTRASVLDTPAETETPIFAYNVWRMIGGGAPGAASAAAGTSGSTAAGAANGAASIAGAACSMKEAAASTSMTTSVDRAKLVSLLRDPATASGVRVSGSDAIALGLPPGDWESVGFWFATRDLTYNAAVPTKDDSTEAGTPLETFVVTAHTMVPGIFVASEPVVGYSVDNLAPPPVTGLAGAETASPHGLEVTWSQSAAPDVGQYNLYRGDDALFVPDASNLLGQTSGTAFHDGTWFKAFEYFYKLVAVDRHGNMGPAALLRPEDVKVGTMLESYAASLEGSGIEVTWRLAEADEGVSFAVLRSADGGEFAALVAPEVAREELTFTMRDRSVEPGRTYRYRVAVVEASGARVLFETEAVATPELPLTLNQNHPNPFNPVTTIGYYLPAAGPVTLDVYDSMGRRIVRLVDGVVQERGVHEAVWSGCDGAGRRVSSGVYFYRLTAGKETISRKMVLMR